MKKNGGREYLLALENNNIKTEIQIEKQPILSNNNNNQIIKKTPEYIYYDYLKDIKYTKSTSSLITEDINTYIINKEKEELLKIISLCNYGIYDDNEIILHLYSKFKKTGGTLDKLRKFSGVFEINISSTSEERLQEIEKFIYDTKHYNNFYIELYGTSPNSKLLKYKNYFIDRLINNETLTLDDDIIIYRNNKTICDIIINNKQKSENEDMILNVKRIRFNNNIIQEFNSYTFTKKFEYYEYNKALILGYEIGLYLLKDSYQSFIDEQQEYLNSLHIINKKTINDYTKILVSEHYIKPYNKDPLIFKASIANKNIGDAFAYFVCMFIINWINHKDKSYLYQPNIYAEIQDFFDKYKRNNLPSNNERCHNLYYLISDDDWRIILNIYLDNLNQIILNAPELKTDLFVYRGANSNYLKTDKLTITLKPLYVSTRIASYSINYEASKMFYELASPNGIMFRVLLDKGTRALFITPLTDHNLDSEMEILTANSQLLSVYESYEELTDPFKITTESYNNINNTNCLSLNNEDKIKTHNFLHSIPFKNELPLPGPPIYIPRDKSPNYREHFINYLPYKFDDTYLINDLIKLPGRQPLEEAPMPPLLPRPIPP
jgi:hypothetical protein